MQRYGNHVKKVWFFYIDLRRVRTFLSHFMDHGFSYAETFEKIYIHSIKDGREAFFECEFVLRSSKTEFEPTGIIKN